MMTLRWIIIIALVLCATPAHSYTCDDVRAAYKAYGASVLRQWAKHHNIPLHQQRKAIRCIHSDRVTRRPKR